MTRKVHTSIEGFGTLNTSSPAHMINERELQVCDNLYFGKARELIKRPGVIELLSSVATPSNTLGGLWVINNTGSHIVYYGVSANLYNSIDGAAMASVLTGTTVEWVIKFKEDTYFGTTGGGIRKRTGVGAFSVLTNSPASAKHGVFHKNRLFVINSSVSSYQIRWSDPPGDPGFPTPFTEWPSENTWDVGTDNINDPIVALVSYNDLLFIFKQYTTWVLYVQGDSPGQWILRQASSEFGLVHKTSYFVAENYLYVLGNNRTNSTALYRTDGTSFHNLSDPIQGWPWTDIRGLGQYEDMLLMFDISSDIIYAYDYKLDVWSKWILGGFTSIAHMAAGITALGDKTVYLIGGQSGNKLFRFSVAVSTDLVHSDNGIGYTSKFRTREWLSRPDELTRFLWAYVDYDSASGIDARYITETGTNELAVAASGGTRSVIRVPAPQLRRRLAYEFDDGGATDPCTFYSFGMEVITRDRVAKAKMG